MVVQLNTGQINVNTIMISYDLNKAGKDYTAVTTYIKSLGPWARPLRSQWLVKTDTPLKAVVDGLRSNGADGDDSLLVIDVTSRGAAWFNLSPAVSDWIRTSL